MLYNQIGIFDCLEEKKDTEITKEQQETIDKIIYKNINCEVVVYKSGVVGVIADYDPKIIVPQGDTEKQFKPKWTRKTYFVYREGNIVAIAVGEVR